MLTGVELVQPGESNRKDDYMNPATQKGKILGYCAEHGSITNREAAVLLNMNSPSKRISELRRAGYDVQSVWEERVNSEGDKVRYLRYFITAPEGGVS